MNNKILLGSIIAVVILVLVSFTGVVGYQTTKSSTIAKASPLFSVRSKRAIDEESRDLTCDYVGKGEENIISIPKRDERTILIQKVIELISKMDDKEFNEFIAFLKYQKFWEHSIKYEGLTNNIIIRENISKDWTFITCIPAFICGPTRVITICDWVPNCIMTRIFVVIVVTLLNIALKLYPIFEQFTLVPCGKCGPYPDTCTYVKKLNLL